MSNLSVEDFGIAASCPSRVAINTTTTFEGTINYTLVNGGNEDAVVNILAEMVDTADHRVADSRTFVGVAAGDTAKFDHALRLPASYDQAGTITVTVRLSLEGGVAFSDSTFCEFVVG